MKGWASAMGHGVTLGLPTTPVHLFMEEKMMEEENDLGELSLCSEARSSEKPRTNEGN